MKKQAVFCMAAALSLLLTACGSQTPQEEVSQALGIDVSSGQVISASDDHGGFHGDGTTFVQLQCSDGEALKQIEESGDWEAFPLDRTAQALVYGVTEETGTEETGITICQTGPYLNDSDGNPLVPEIQEGYYRLIDRHAQAGESDILDRHSFNFPLALYDTETDTLYFCELDT